MMTVPLCILLLCPFSGCSLLVPQDPILRSAESETSRWLPDCPGGTVRILEPGCFDHELQRTTGTMYQAYCTSRKGDKDVRNGPYVCLNLEVIRRNRPTRRGAAKRRSSHYVRQVWPAVLGQYSQGHPVGDWFFDCRINKHGGCTARAACRYDGNNSVTRQSNGPGRQWWVKHKVGQVFISGMRQSIGSEGTNLPFVGPSSGYWHQAYEGGYLRVQHRTGESEGVVNLYDDAASFELEAAQTKGRWKVPHIWMERRFVSFMPKTYWTELRKEFDVDFTPEVTGVWEADSLPELSTLGTSAVPARAEFWVPIADGEWSCKERSRCWKLWAIEYTGTSEEGLVGQYAEYHPNGKKAAHGHLFSPFVSSQQLRTRATSDAGISSPWEVGEWSYWYPDGSSAGTVSFGTLATEGPCPLSETLVKPDGRLLQQGNYDACKKDGVWILEIDGEKTSVTYQAGRLGEEVAKSVVDSNRRLFLDAAGLLAATSNRKLKKHYDPATVKQTVSKAQGVSRNVYASNALLAELYEVCEKEFPRRIGGCYSNDDPSLPANAQSRACHLLPRYLQEGVVLSVGECRKAMKILMPTPE